MKKILIVGATSAIARSTQRLWAERGDALFLLARSEEKLAAVAKDLRVRGAADVHYAAADLSDPSKHSALIEEAAEKLGGLDVVLIAYGSLPEQRSLEPTYQATEEALRTNFLSVVSWLTPLANRFEAQKSGTLAVISSVAGDRGRSSNYIYGTAKGALSIFLQGLRNRLHKAGVNVLTIKPGFVDTPMTADIKKNALFATPEQVAKGIVRAIDKGADVAYLPGFWRGVMLIIGAIPERIFKRLNL